MLYKTACQSSHLEGSHELEKTTLAQHNLQTLQGQKLWQIEHSNYENIFTETYNVRKGSPRNKLGPFLLQGI